MELLCSSTEAVSASSLHDARVRLDSTVGRQQESDERQFFLPVCAQLAQLPHCS